MFPMTEPLYYKLHSFALSVMFYLFYKIKPNLYLTYKKKIINKKTNIMAIYENVKRFLIFFKEKAYFLYTNTVFSNKNTNINK